MPLDPDDPSRIFVHALAGQLPTPDQLLALDPRWAEPIQAAIAATPGNRRAALLLARSGVDDFDRLLAVLRGNPDVQDRPWPDPTPFGTLELPPFPVDALPDWLATYVRAEASATQVPPDLVGMLALAVLSSCVAGPIVLNPWGDWLEPLNLFTMVVLPPGHRKSAIFTTVTAPLHQFEAEAAQHAAPALALARRRQHAAEQALLRAQDAAAICPDDDPRRPQLLEAVEQRLADLAALELPVVPRLITDDCSSEKLAMLLAEQDGRLAILSPEGGIFDLIAGRYSSTGAPNLDHYLKGHAGDPIVVDRVSRAGEIIPRPALTVGLAVQPEVLRGLVARPGFHGRGLLARFLYAIPNATLGRRAISPAPVSAPVRTEYHHRIRALLTLTHPTPPSSCSSSPFSTLVSGTPADARGLPLSRARERGSGGEGVLPFSPPAADRLRDFAESVEPRLAPGEDLDPIVDWASKLVGATARIAGLLYLASLNHPCPRSPIPSPLVESAIAFAHYLVEHAKAAYNAMGLDPVVANVPDLLAWIRRTGRQSFTRRDARRSMIGRLRSDADLDDALDQLEQHAFIRLRPHQRRPGQGRPPGPAYDVHPSLVSR